MIDFLLLVYNYYYLSFVISFIFDILCRITIYSERHSVFSWGHISDVTSEIQSFDVTFKVACKLSHPMGKTELSSIAKYRTNSVSFVRNHRLPAFSCRISLATEVKMAW